MSDDASVDAEGEAPDEGAAAEEATPTTEAAGEPASEESAAQEPAAQEPAEAVTVVAVVGLSPQAVARVTDALPGWTVVDDVSTDPLGLAVISSRTPTDIAQTALAQFSDHCRGPIVVVTHPGGEDATVQLLAAGATLAVPEGRENRIASLFADASLAQDLVDAYMTFAGTSRERSGALQTDEHAGIPGLLAFHDALAESASDPNPPRILVVTARDLEQAIGGMNTGIANLLRRRIAQQVQNAVRPFGAEVYALDKVRFASLVPNDESLVEQIVEPLRIAIESYAPVRGRSLRLAMGHAGIEDADDPAVMLDLAERACAIALETSRRVVSAAELVEAVADRTNLLTLLGAVAAVEARTPELAGHAARVADLATAIAEAAGMTGDPLRRLATAARFHDVGKLSLPLHLAGSEDGLEGEELALWRTHAERSASALTPAAGSKVAGIVRHHHEAYDGSGFPDALSGDAIPLESRIIAVADAFDVALTRMPTGEGLGMDGAIRAVIDRSGTKLDPVLVEHLVGLVQRRRLPHSLTG